MLSQEDLTIALTEKLLACGMDDTTRRENVLALIPAEIKQGIMRGEGDTDRTAVFNIVRRVLEFAEGVEQLTYSICQITGRTEKWQELDLFVQKQFPAVATYADRKNLLTTAQAIEWPENVLMKTYLLSIPEGWARSNFYRESNLLPPILKDLAKIGRRGHDTFPVLEFVERLALYADDQGNETVRDDLRSWASWKAFELNLDSTHLEHLREKIRNTHSEKAPYLLIMFDSDDTESEMNIGPSLRTYNIQAWLLDDQYNVVDVGITIEDTPRTLENIAQMIGYLLEQLLNVESLVDTIDDLMIELLLPDELLNHDFYRWPVTIGDDELVLGLQHKVVVRSARRATKRLYWPAWRNKWTQLQEILKNESCSEDFVCTCSRETCRVHTGSSCSILVCGREECQTREHLQAVLRGSPIVCLALTYAPSAMSMDGNNIFRTLLQVGMPVALWPRESINNAETLASLLSCNALNSLPRKVWEWRKNAVIRGDEHDIGNYLTLLWDDPFRLPPPAIAPQFGAPVKKG